MKKKEKLLKKRNDRYKHFEELVRAYVELKHRLKALE